MTGQVVAVALLGAAGSIAIAWAAATAARQPTSWRRFLPAALVASTATGLALGYAGLPVAVTAALAAASALVIAAALVDALEHRLPNVFTIPLTAAGLPALAVVSWVTGWGSPPRAILGLLIFGGWMLLLALTGVGAGDVKLAAGVGMWLSWISWWALAAGLAVALIGMAITGLANRIRGGRPRSPLGPAIGAGMFVGIAVAASLG